MSSSRKILWPVVVAAAAALLVAALGGTVTDIGPWYQGLKKPDWQPPDWLFGPVWTFIFATAALSGVTAWRWAESKSARDWIIVLFAVNGILNIGWSLLFFRMRRPDWALLEVGFLFLSIVALIVVTSRYSRLSGLLLWPYLGWVAFAAVLNYEIVKLNGPF